VSQKVNHTNTAVELEDPYRLTADGIMDPPKGWRQSFRYLGPGLILSAGIVGSGELIATTTLGAQAGFVLLWLVIFSTFVKVAVQVELARWTIVTGQPAIEGYNKVTPKFGRVSWVNALWVVLMLSKYLQNGGIVGGTAIAFSIMFPIGGDPLGFTSTAIWVAIVVAATILGLYSSKYNTVEKGAFVSVVIFSFVTILIALGLPFTPFAYGMNDIASGLSLALPLGVIGAAIAMFGITGVGADEMTYYTYWCIEKGYARWVGPNDGSKAWKERARGWIKVMYKDAFVSWVIYTFATLAFFIMGAAVLNPQGLIPKGNEMITTLSRMYTDILGGWASFVFLLGAIAALGSTLWASTASFARMYSNFLSVIGVFSWSDVNARLRWIKTFTVLNPILWGAVYLFVQSPVIMVQIGGVMTGIFLLAVVAAVWYLRKHEVDPELYGGSWFNALLVISSISIVLLGVYTLLNVLGLMPKF